MAAESVVMRKHTISMTHQHHCPTDALYIGCFRVYKITVKEQNQF